MSEQGPGLLLADDVYKGVRISSITESEFCGLPRSLERHGLDMCERKTGIGRVCRAGWRVR